jgi:hypothetical protein
MIRESELAKKRKQNEGSSEGREGKVWMRRGEE